MSFLTDFKNFAMRGNVIDLAVGVIIGGAFGKIVSSLVTNIIMPPVGFYLAVWISKNYLSIFLTNLLLLLPKQKLLKYRNCLRSVSQRCRRFF